MLRKQYIFLAAAIVFAGALVTIAVTQKNFGADTGTERASTTVPVFSSEGVTGTGEFVVRKGDETQVTIPDFLKPIRFGASVSADVRAAIQKAAATVEERLTKDQFDLKSWNDLAILRKMGGDYKAAEEAWKFIIEAAPQDATAFMNLGELYQGYIKDYPKAEQMYLHAIKLNPKVAQSYRELSVLYTNFYKKGTTAAEEILKKGVNAAPDSVDLHVLLARLYKSKSMNAEARAEYEAAISAANRSGQSGVAESLKTEENQL